MTEQDVQPPHENVALWDVHAEDTEGSHDATIGTTTVTADDNAVLATVQVFVSLIDGAVCVNVDTVTGRPVPVRVCVNDGDVHNTGSHVVFNGTVE